MQKQNPSAAEKGKEAETENKQDSGKGGIYLPFRLPPVCFHKQKRRYPGKKEEKECRSGKNQIPKPRSCAIYTGKITVYIRDKSAASF